jgi:transposase
MSYQTSNPKDEFIMSTMDDLVPEDHLVRKLIKHIKFDFIRDLAKPYYSDIGRPGYDPVILFKIAILKSIFGIPSIRKTCEEIQVNIAYRYFLGIPFSENTPDHSTYSRAYTTRFHQTDIFDQVFYGIIEQIDHAHLIDATYIFIDSTHIKASANKGKHIESYVKAEKSVFEEEVLNMINEERKEHQQKPIDPKEPKDELKRKKESKTDPDSGWLNKGEKEHVFAYNSHAVCDRHGYVLGQVLKPSNMHDSQVFNEVFNIAYERYHDLIEATGVDAGYKTGPIIKTIADKQILPLMPYKRTNKKKGDFSNKAFIYDQEQDCYTCPNFEILTYVTTSRQGYKEYSLDKTICQSCPLKDHCLSQKAVKRTLRISVYKEYFDFAEEIRLSDYGKEKYALRKQTIERVFGDFKERHGGRYTHYRGIKKVSDHTLLGFACLNMKKMALRLSERVSESCLFNWAKQFSREIIRKIAKKNPILIPIT